MNRTPDSYLAGGAALNIEPSSKRFSNALDYFHDSGGTRRNGLRRGSRAARGSRHELRLVMNQPGDVRAVVEKADQSTKIEWAHDSAWRFLPR